MGATDSIMSVVNGLISRSGKFGNAGFSTSLRFGRNDEFVGNPKEKQVLRLRSG